MLTMGACGGSEPKRLAGTDLPDLVALPATDLRYEATAPTRELLRLEVEFVNRGDAALEIAPAGKTEECGAGRAARQRAYDSQKKRKTSPAGCLQFHKSHDHWHLLDMANYELLDADDEVVGSSVKVSYCMEDVRRVEKTGPEDLVYGDCDRDSVQGLSVGWGDPYYADLAGQWIEITNLDDGDYCVRVTVDPNDHIAETNDKNNQSRQGVRLKNGTLKKIACP